LKDLPEPEPPVKPKPKPEPKPQPKPQAKPVPVPLPRPIPVPLTRPIQVPVYRAEHKAEQSVPSRGVPNLPDKTEPNQQDSTAKSLGKPDSVLRTPEKGGKEALRGEGLLKPKRGTRDDLAKLFPSARNMAKMEEGFRDKYLNAEQGDTRLMDTDDPLIGSFARRFGIVLKERLNSLDRLDRKGIGMTVLNLRFKRDGTIDDIKVLYSSGNKSLDDLAVRASRSAGYVGPLPRKWQFEVYNMICAFIVEQGLVATRWE
jgi:protein TonB